MAPLSKEDRIVRQIIKAHGPVIDLEANPEVFIEIVRKHALDIADFGSDAPGTGPDAGGGGGGPKGGLASDAGLPGGVGPVGPTSFQGGPGIPDLMKELLKLQRQVAKLEQRLTS